MKCKLIAEPSLAAPKDNVEYKPTAQLTETEDRIKEQMRETASDTDELMRDILLAVSMRYDCFIYDDRDKTGSLLDLLVAQTRIEEFDAELTRKIVKHIHIYYGRITAELINDVRIDIEGV